MAPLRLADLSLPPEVLEELAVILHDQLRADSVERARRHLCELSWEDGRIALEIARQLLVLSESA